MTMGAELEVFEYLTGNNLHTKVTLNHFARKFLIYRYDSNLLKKIGEEIKRRGKLSYLKFQSSRIIHLGAKKLLLRILRY